MNLTTCYVFISLKLDLFQIFFCCRGNRYLGPRLIYWPLGDGFGCILSHFCLFSSCLFSVFYVSFQNELGKYCTARLHFTRFGRWVWCLYLRLISACLVSFCWRFYWLSFDTWCKFLWLFVGWIFNENWGYSLRLSLKCPCYEFARKLVNYLLTYIRLFSIIW